MGLFGSSRVSWYTRCESDPRFDMRGDAPGMLSASKAINDAILAKAKELGIREDQIPEIEYGGCKD